MEASVKLVSLANKLLYDGLDEDFYQFSFQPQLPGFSVVSTSAAYENFFHKLIPIIGPQAFSQILAEGNFLKYSNEYAFKGSDKLPLKFFLSGSFMLVLALGEFQPSRHKIYLEGVWQVEYPAGLQQKPSG